MGQNWPTYPQQTIQINHVSFNTGIQLTFFTAFLVDKNRELNNAYIDVSKFQFKSYKFGALTQLHMQN